MSWDDERVDVVQDAPTGHSQVYASCVVRPPENRRHVEV